MRGVSVPKKRRRIPVPCRVEILGRGDTKYLSRGERGADGRILAECARIGGGELTVFEQADLKSMKTQLCEQRGELSLF